MALNLAYFNYAKANKLKVKASKRIKKLLSTGNGDNNPKKLRNKTNQSDTKQDETFESTKFDEPKKRCGNCGKWGNHTAEECTANGKSDNSSKSEEVNLASSGKGKLLLGESKKNFFLDYNDSEDEEDSLHYHNNNRIKACEITKADYVYFTQSYSEEDPRLEPEWEL